MSRSNPSISRDHSYTSDHNSGKEPSWFSDFVDNLNKQAVKSKREDYSLYDQINAIVGDKASKFSSVEEKVSDMINRTGLKKMLEAKAQLIENDHSTPTLFSSIPELKTFIDNYIDARPGTSIDAVIHDALKINQIKNKLPEGDDMPEEVKRYINNKISDELGDRTNLHRDDMQLGKVDMTIDKNTVDDPLAVCMPNRDTSQ